MRFVRLVPLAVLALVPARAEVSVPADLRALLEEADRANPEILAGEARTRGALELPARLQALPEPKLTVAYTNDGLESFTLGSSEFSNVSVGWEQEVPPRGARDAAAGVAEAEVEVSRLTVAGLRASLRARVIALYADLYRLDRSAALLAESRDLLATELTAARSRYEAGQGSQEGLLRAQAAIRRLDLAGEELRRDRRGVELAMNAALGHPSERGIGPASVLPEGEVPADPETVGDAAARAAPSVREATGRTSRAEAALGEAKTRTKPEFSWMAAYQFRGGLDPMVMGGFGVRLPVWKRQDQARGIAQSEAELDAARHDVATAAIRARTEALTYLSEAVSAGRRLELYRDALVPEETAALEASRAAFSAGKSELSAVLAAYGRLIEARREAIVLEAARIQALAGLEAVTGLSLIGRTP
jgi:outer membrane protein TolC